MGGEGERNILPILLCQCHNISRYFMTSFKLKHKFVNADLSADRECEREKQTNKQTNNSFFSRTTDIPNLTHPKNQERNISRKSIFFSNYIFKRLNFVKSSSERPN